MELKTKNLSVAGRSYLNKSSLATISTIDGKNTSRKKVKFKVNINNETQLYKSKISARCKFFTGDEEETTKEIRNLRNIYQKYKTHASKYQILEEKKMRYRTNSIQKKINEFNLDNKNSYQKNKYNFLSPKLMPLKLNLIKSPLIYKHNPLEYRTSSLRNSFDDAIRGTKYLRRSIQ
mmetsp:Transcript_28040/g.24771  ORF Transcript_28040/g.24771 Transcript_28040/m.24771 type:complete len:177 (+) Transcript_28040:301-831(+)